MPIYVLDPRTPISVQQGALEVTLHATGAASRCRLEVRDPSGGTLLGLITPGPITAILPVVAGKAVVSVVPASGDFPPGSSVGLSLSIERAGAPNDVVQVPGIDVSGLPRAELAAIDPRSGSLVISAPEEEFALGEVATAARTVTRRVLGVTRVAEDTALAPTLAVDASASMRELARAGALEPAIEVLVGVSAVIALRPLRVAVVGDHARLLPQLTPQETAKAVVAELTRLPAVLGSRGSHRSLRGLAPDDNSVVYLVTDGFPPDIDAVLADDQVEGEARHLVVLAPPGFDIAGAPVLTTHIPVPEPGRTASAPLSATAVEDVVRGLLRGCFVPGTPLAEAVDR